jgi:uncharacterized membrane protein YcaP (DUF421 family)
VLTALVRSITAFVILYLITRMMGKKQISQLTFFDYVVGITIGSIAATMSVEPETEPLPAIVAISTWGLLVVFLGWLSLRGHSWEKLINGEPTVVIRDGKILEKNMGTARYSIADLLMQLRRKNVFNVADVEVALLEANGELSVLKKSELQPLTPRSLDIPVSERGMPSVVIEDGTVLTDTLEHLGRSEEWLQEKLREQCVESVHEVVVAQLDGYDELHVDLRDDSSAQPRPKRCELLAADLDALEADLHMFALETDRPQSKQLFEELANRLHRTKERVKPLLLH